MADTLSVFENIQDVIVIRIPGQDLTHLTGESIHDQMPSDQNSAKPSKVVLDLSNLTFIGSIGLTVLVILLKRIKTAGGHLLISGLTGQCRNVMTVTRLDMAFEFCEDIDQGVAKLQSE